jgi:putative DNA primase/helicase
VSGNPFALRAGCPTACGEDVLLVRTDGRVQMECLGEDPCSPTEIALSLGVTPAELAALADDIVFTPGASPTNSDVIDWAEEVPAEDVDRARLLLRYIRQQGKDVVRTPEKGWLIWEGENWTPASDNDVELRALAHEVADHLFDAAEAVFANSRALYDVPDAPQGGTIRRGRRQTGADAAKERQQHAAKLARASVGFRRSSFIDCALRELPAVDPANVSRSFTEFDRNPDVLGVRNGVVDLRTGELRPYRKDDLITRRIDVHYDPAAVNPRWERFLSEIFVDTEDQPDPELAAYMHRLIGYGITGHVSEQILPVLFGQGSNGKGVLIETLQAIFKAHTVTTPFSTFEARPSGGIPNDLAAMAGARLVMASEGEQGAPMAEAVVKRLTGGDTISARFMRAEWFEFEPTFLILLATNYKPNFRGQDYGLWRRVKLIPMRRKFEAADKDTYLSKKFVGKQVPANSWKAEDDFGDGPAGILAWAVRGAVEWYARGLAEPASIRQETDRFRSEQDRIGEFLSTYFDVTGKRSDTVPLSKAWNAHHDWAEANREIPVKVKQTFSNMLSERQGITRDTRPNGAVFFRGARLLTDHERLVRERADERAAVREGRDLVALPGLTPLADMPVGAV